MTSEHPPITPSQRAAMAAALDYSDAAVARWAGDLVERWGEEKAVENARFYREMYHPGTEGAKFWSRVLVRLLAPVHVGVDLAPGPDVTVETHIVRDEEGAPVRLEFTQKTTDWFDQRGLKTEPLPAPAAPRSKEEAAPIQRELF